jgi:hypothetical protein
MEAHTWGPSSQKLRQEVCEYKNQPRLHSETLSYLKKKKKKIKKNRAGGLAQVVEHLSSKYKTLNSNPSTT